MMFERESLMIVESLLCFFGLEKYMQRVLNDELKMALNSTRCASKIKLATYTVEFL